MLRFIVGAFILLHGLVHLLYFGQSWRFFQLQPGMVWPEGSWIFSRLLGSEATKWVAGISCILAALGFVIGGGGILLKQPWWRTMVVAAAAFSTIVFVLLWDGHLQKLSDQGAIAILINSAILVAVLVLRWPNFGY